MSTITKNLTRGELLSELSKHRFVLLRYSFNGKLVGFNCSVLKLKWCNIHNDQHVKTNFSSFIPCDFITYIHYKVGFGKGSKQ